MPVEPLPADLRMLCDCTGGCDFAWEGPQKRVWARWLQAIPVFYPILATGILFEIVPASIQVQNCQWLPVTDQTPFVLLEMTRVGQSPFTGTGGSYIVEGVDSIGFAYAAQLAFTPDDCESTKLIDEIVDTFAPPINSDVLLTPVEWWQNANDVPH